MIGKNIRNIRKSQNKTISDISEATGLSLGYISQVERDLIEPSISSLRKIANTLNTPLYFFIEDNDEKDVKVKKEDRLSLKLPNSPVLYDIMSPLPTKDFDPSMLALYFEIKPNLSDTESYITHASEELIIIIEGKAKIHLGNKEFILKPGDTIYIYKNIPHKIINLSSKPLKGISVFSPPSYPNNKNGF